MKTSIHLNKGLALVVRLLIGILAMLSASSLSTSSIAAAGWGTASSVICTGGDSQLWWYDYYPWDWGKSWGYLWHWNGSSWDLRNSGYGEGSGASGSAVAGTSASDERGYWTETGAHQASFFSGTVNSYSNIVSC